MIQNNFLSGHLLRFTNKLIKFGEADLILSFVIFNDKVAFLPKRQQFSQNHYHLQTGESLFSKPAFERFPWEPS